MMNNIVYDSSMFLFNHFGGMSPGSKYIPTNDGDSEFKQTGTQFMLEAIKHFKISSSNEIIDVQKDYEKTQNNEIVDEEKDKNEELNSDDKQKIENNDQRNIVGISHDEITIAEIIIKED